MNNKNIDDNFDNVIKLHDELGNEVSFEFLDLIEYLGSEYIILFPVKDTEAGEVVILKVEDCTNSDSESFISVEDENILQNVFEIFKEKFKDEFNFLD